MARDVPPVKSLPVIYGVDSNKNRFNQFTLLSYSTLVKSKSAGNAAFIGDGIPQPATGLVQALKSGRELEDAGRRCAAAFRIKPIQALLPMSLHLSFIRAHLLWPCQIEKHVVFQTIVVPYCAERQAPQVFEQSKSSSKVSGRLVSAKQLNGLKQR